MVDADLCFRLMSSRQWLTTFDPVDTVGGTTMRVTSHADGFRFSAMFTRVGPRYMEVESATFVGGKLRVTFRVPEGVDGSPYQIIVVPGDRPPPGAGALVIPETGKGLILTGGRAGRRRVGQGGVGRRSNWWFPDHENTNKANTTTKVGHIPQMTKKNYT